MKKRMLKNENGYSFFIALLVSVLFIVLAVSLLSVTMSGLTKTTTREQIVQSTELSDKGMKHIVQDIYTELKNAIDPEIGLPSAEFQTTLVHTLEDYLCDGGSKTLTVDAETGRYETCIDEINDEAGNQLRKIVSLKSTGIVDGKERTIMFTVAIGADPVPDALNYALGVHKTCTQNRNCIDGEGNLFLHGASEIVGDVKVDGNIVTSDKAYALLDGYDRWIESLYPSIKPRHSLSTPKLVLGGKIYILTKNPNDYKTHIRRTNFNVSGYREAAVNEAFAHPPQLVQRSPVRQKIEITEQRQNYRFRMNDSGVVKLDSGSDLTFQNERHSGKKVFAYHRSCILFFCEDKTDGNYIMTGNNVFGQFATDGNLTIREGKVTFENGLYVDGDLTIGNPSISSTEFDPNKYEKIEISGPIYVNGDLKIIGANVKFNALIYVNGDARNSKDASVVIRNSQINGLEKDGKEGSLIIFANEEIKISNNSVNQDNPSRIRGYFYSDDALEMFGVGSNLRIEGGISARRVVLNAIRGRSSSKKFDGSQRITSNAYFEGKQNQVGKNSRLTIIYNPEIINTYSDLKGQEPVIYEVSPPKILSRN